MARRISWSRSRACSGDLAGARLTQAGFVAVFVGERSDVAMQVARVPARRAAIDTTTATANRAGRRRLGNRMTERA
jgi:hypothetical protein